MAPTSPRRRLDDPAWTQAYKHSEDEAYRSEMLHAIDTLARLYESSRDNPTGAIPAGVKTPGIDAENHNFPGVYWLQNNLLMASEFEAAIPDLPDEIAESLRALQQVVDETAVTKLDHHLDPDSPEPFGFQQRGRPDLPLRADGTMVPGDGRGEKIDSKLDNYTTDWAYGYGSPLSSELANLFIERYRANQDSRFLEAVRKAADHYLQIDPPAEDTAPYSLAAVIRLMVDVSELTGDDRYLERAAHFGDVAERMFLDGSPLPRASSSNSHYEAINGGDDLMLALWYLSQHAE